MGDDLIIKRNRLAPGGDDGVPLEDHAQLAGFGGDSRVHGAVKFRARRGGLPVSSSKLIWTPTSPTNKRRALSRKLTDVPRKRGRNPLSEFSGTNPREFSRRNGAMKSKSRPPILARVFPAINSASTAL